MEDNGKSKEDIAIESKVEVRPPKKYKVFLHNDDYTTMEFVVFILQKVFHKNLEEATAIMLKVHQEGVGLCGIYNFEVAETKVQTVISLSRKEGHPLQCTMSADD